MPEADKTYRIHLQPSLQVDCKQLDTLCHISTLAPGKCGTAASTEVLNMGPPNKGGQITSNERNKRLCIGTELLCGVAVRSTACPPLRERRASALHKEEAKLLESQAWRVKRPARASLCGLPTAPEFQRSQNARDAVFVVLRGTRKLPCKAHAGMHLHASILHLFQ